MFYKKNISGDFRKKLMVLRASDKSENPEKVLGKNCLEKVKLATSRLPVDVKKLLTDHIDSVNQLEVLLVFFNNKNRPWNAAAMSHELRSHETIVKQQIQRLCESGFLKESGKGEYIYAPSKELDEKVDLLCRTYKEMSVAIIAYIYEKPTDKLKGFADAFKFKKD